MPMHNAWQRTTKHHMRNRRPTRLQLGAVSITSTKVLFLVKAALETDVRYARDITRFMVAVNKAIGPSNPYRADGDKLDNGENVGTS